MTPWIEYWDEWDKLLDQTTHPRSKVPALPEEYDDCIVGRLWGMGNQILVYSLSKLMQKEKRRNPTVEAAAIRIKEVVMDSRKGYAHLWPQILLDELQGPNVFTEEP